MPPARRDHWLAALDADEEGASVALAQLAPGLIPMEEMGHSGGIEGQSFMDEIGRKAGWEL